jgi:hypothetical protein
VLLQQLAVEVERRQVLELQRQLLGLVGPGLEPELPVQLQLELGLELQHRLPHPVVCIIMVVQGEVLSEEDW